MKKRNNNFRCRLSSAGFMRCFFVAMFFAQNTVSAQQTETIVRISEIEVYPEYVREYAALLIEEAVASVNLEPGVLAIFPMYRQEDSTRIRILEMYGNETAYQLHLKTPHFKKYKNTTLKMVKSLKLIDMNAVDPELMKMIFTKVKE